MNWIAEVGVRVSRGDRNFQNFLFESELPFRTKSSRHICHLGSFDFHKVKSVDFYSVSSNQVSRQCQQALAKRAYLLWHTLNIHQRILTQNYRAETNMAHMHTHQSQRHSSSSDSYASGLKMNQICCLKTLKNTNIHQSVGFYGYIWHWRPRKTRCSLVIRQVSNGKV